MMNRRRLLASTGPLALGASAGAAASACAAPVPGTGSRAGASEVYIGLGRLREVAILDAVSDRIVGRVSLGAFGDQGAPAQISVGPSGSAAVIPLVSRRPAVALIQQQEHAPRPKPSATPEATRVTRRTAWLPLSNEAGQSVNAFGTEIPETAQRMSADARGNAYVVVGDGGAHTPPEIAVVALRSGAVQRRLQVASAGETIFSLQAEPSGERLNVCIWTWGQPGVPPPGGVRGRLVSLDARQGTVLSRASLPETACILDLALSAAPPGAPAAGGACVYGIMITPGPSREELSYAGIERRYALVAFDPDTLDPVATWPLDWPAATFAIADDGRSAYLLTGPRPGGPSSHTLTCLDLTASSGYTPAPPVRSWQMPDGCFSMTLSPLGKLYVADALGDRLWRFDARRNVMLGAISLPGAPLTVAARPT